MPKHARGPFNITDSYTIDDTDGRTVCMIPIMTENSPNTKLLIASPDLLQALKAAINDITLHLIAEGKDDRYFETYGTAKTKTTALAQALNAVELATGFRPKFVAASEDSSSVSRWTFIDD